MMRRMSTQSVLFLVLLLCSICTRHGCGASSSEPGEPKVRCVDVERQALLNIKRSLQETWNHVSDDALSSWGSEDEKRDCCNWLGIKCANGSDRVVSLDLSPSTLGISDFFLLPALEGKISPSLFELRYLTYLDLSRVAFSESQIPSSMGTLSQLRYLNLSETRVSGKIPLHLGNLSRLEVLDLGGNALTPTNLEWASHISSLRILDLSGTDLRGATDWVQRVNQLPSLTTLKLSGCFLPYIIYPPSLSTFVNSSTSLSVIDLSVNSLSGPIFSWLFNFSSSLASLDLSYNNLQGLIPESFEKMHSLKNLNLGFNKLYGSIPKGFGNMSALEELDLSRNQLYGSIPEGFGNMTALRHLDASFNELNGSIPEAFSKLTALEFLYLSNNKLYGSIPEGFGNMTALTHLNVYHNELNGSIPETFSKLIVLELLDFSDNRLSGSIPEIFGNMSALEELSLRNNTLIGEIPRSIWNVSTLRWLSVGSNNLSGCLPETMSQLKQLKLLNIHGNSFRGVVSHAHFSNLSGLTDLDLSFNSLSLNFHSDWIPPFHLSTIMLGSCKLGPQFPKWLRTQENYLYLDISNNEISDSIPNWFWNVPRFVSLMDLSDNQITGEIGNHSLPDISYVEIDLSSNQLEGLVPSFLFEASFLDLSLNRFSKLNLPCDVTGKSNLLFLDISNNELSGELLDCWSYFQNLEILSLTNNKLSGRIPTSIGSLSNIQSLKLSNNNFMGEVPSTLKRCTELLVIDFGENNLSGMIPTWMGKSLSNLTILILRSNQFYGSIPYSLCHLSSLQVLDLSLNAITGSIPKCISNFSAMKKNGRNITFPNSFGGHTLNGGIAIEWKERIENQLLFWKGQLREFKNTLVLVKSIELSSNKLNGEIPREISELFELVSLNLSRNNLSGQIPAEIGRMKSLDVLDLSWNQFIGQIPPSLAHIDRLNHLDLSNNNLSGKIPIGTQLQSFQNAYTGNPELCGDPLPKNCLGTEQTVFGASNEESGELLSMGFYISMALGFMTAFWGVCGALIFNKSFRYAYFKLLNDVGDQVFVTAAIQKTKLLRMIRN